MNDSSPPLSSESVLAALPAAVAVFAPDGKLRFLNAAMAVLLALDGAGAAATGWTRTDLARRLGYQGLLGDGAPEQRAKALADAALGPRRHLLRSLDRRAHEWLSASLPNGGHFVVLQDCTAQTLARDHAEADLRQLSEVLDRLDTGIVRYDGDRRVVVTNPAYCSLLGLAPGQVHPGLPLADILDRQENAGQYEQGGAQRVRAGMERRIAQGGFWGVERTRPDGRTIRVSNQPLSDGGWISEVMDITDKHATQEAAGRRAALQDALLAALPVGIAVYGSDRRCVMVNDAYQRILAHSPIAVGEHLRDILLRRAHDGEFGDGQAEAMVAARMESLHLPHGFERRRPDGGFTLHRRVPLPDGGHAMVVSDITALESAQAEARERAEVLDTMLENMRHGIALFDAKARVVAANRLAAEFCGLAEDAFSPGTHINDLRRQQVVHGVHGGAAETDRFMSNRGRSAVPQGADRYLRPLADGRMIEVITDPLPGGGFVRSYSDVSPLMVAEAEARARAAALESLLDNVRHGIILYDAEGFVILANKLAERLAGFPPDSLRPGIHFDELRDMQARTGEHGDEEARRRYIANRTRAPWTGEGTYQRRRPDGTVLEVRTDLVPGGGCVRAFTDVTALTQAQEDATAKTRMMQAMLDNMRHGIALFDEHSRLISFNSLAQRLMGLPEEEFRLGRTQAEILAAQAAGGEFGGPAEAATRMARMLATDWHQPQVVRRTRHDGTELEVVSSPVPAGGFVLTLTDITARIEAERQAERRATLLETTLNAARAGIALYGPDHRLVAANRQAAEIAGKPDSVAMQGLRIEDMLDDLASAEGATPAQVARLHSLAALDRSRPQHYQRRGRDGRVLDVTSDPTPDGGFVVSMLNVTEVVEAREEAQRRSDVLQAMLENSRQGIILYDAGQRLVAANVLAGTLLNLPGLNARQGVPMAVLLAEQEANRLYGDGAEAARTLVKESLALDRTRPHRMQRGLPDGRCFDIASDPTPDGGFVVTIADVTALMRAEHAAKERAGILQAMIENSSLGVLLYGSDHRLVAANKLAGELFRLPGIETRVGLPLREVLDEQHRLGHFGKPADAAAMRAMYEGVDRSRPFRNTRTTSDGRVLAIASDPTPDGGFVVSASDVTALARAEAEAKRRAEILSVMLGNIRHGIVLFDAAGYIVASNAALRDMLGVEAAALAPGRTHTEMVDALLAAGEYGEGEQGRRIALAIQQRDRTRPSRRTRLRSDGTSYEVVSDPTPDGGWVVTYTDVTEDRHIRDELERARAAAEAANLAKSRFLATMSHELRTPLNAVIGFSEALREGSAPEHTQEFATAIEEAGRHLLSLIDDILDLTRAEEGQLPVMLEPLDALPLLHGIQRMMTGQAEAVGLRLELDAPLPLPVVAADARRLRQILLNLLSNAVKFTKSPGTIILRALPEADGGLLIKVRDSGIGITEADMPRIFQPFAQVDSAASRGYAGSGLGLYLCRVLAEAQGATLTLESTFGEGTVARLRYPPAAPLPDRTA